jgi:hypothetical protein
MKLPFPGWHCMLLALALSSLAPAALASPKYLRVAGSSFVPRDSSTTIQYQTAGCVSRASGTTWISYPVQLPSGSRVVAMRLYYYDNRPSDDLTIAFTAYNMQGAFEDKALFSNGTTSSGYGTVDRAMDVVIDNANWGYQINVLLSASTAGLRLCGARLTVLPPDPIFKDGFE